jgi:hypothetical protein
MIHRQEKSVGAVKEISVANTVTISKAGNCLEQKIGELDFDTRLLRV